MKKIVIILSGVLAASISFNALAAITQGSSVGTGPSAATTGGNMVGNKGGGPCRAIEEACRSAGFVKGGSSSGKGLFKDCMKPVMDGRAVSGVTVNPEDVTACKTRMEKMHQGEQQNGQMRQGSQQ